MLKALDCMSCICSLWDPRGVVCGIIGCRCWHHPGWSGGNSCRLRSMFAGRCALMSWQDLNASAENGVKLMDAGQTTRTPDSHRGCTASLVVRDRGIKDVTTTEHRPRLIRIPSADCNSQVILPVAISSYDEPSSG